MVTSLGVTLLLVVVAMAMRLAVVRRPQHWLASLALLTVEWLDDLVRDIIGQPHPVVATLSGSLFVFIAGCNIAGQLPGTHPVTASLATTSALAMVVFLAVPIAGMRVHGFWEYVKHYVRPNPIFMPLHLLSEAFPHSGSVGAVIRQRHVGAFGRRTPGSARGLSRADADDGARYPYRLTASVHLYGVVHRVHCRRDQCRGGIMTDQTWIAIVSIAAAALTMALGALAAALGESRIGAAAMDALARQPDEAASITRTLFVSLAMIESTAIFCLVIALIVLFANPFIAARG